MAKADAEPRGPEVHIEQAIGRLYRFLAGNRWTRFPWAVIQTFSKAEGALLSGSMAYYTFLSLLPLLMVAAFVIATFADPEPEARAAVAEALNQVFPGVGTDVFEGVINQVVQNSAALGVFGLLSVAYAGSGFVGSMTACLNRMWQVPSGRNPVGQKIVNILIVMMLGTCCCTGSCPPASRPGCASCQGRCSAASASTCSSAGSTTGRATRPASGPCPGRSSRLPCCWSGSASSAS
jgi:hypothetical protein